MLAPSAFDYQKQAIIYIPKAMPDPRAPDLFADGRRRDRQDPGDHARWASVRSGYKQFLDEGVVRIGFIRVGYPCFIQGSMSKEGLLERFRETPRTPYSSPLQAFGKASTYGVNSSSCVIIDKAAISPFPSDPVSPHARNLSTKTAVNHSSTTASRKPSSA
jgi:ATP-dependent DNA helicase DinG